MPPINRCDPCACDPASFMLDHDNSRISIGRILCDLLAGVNDIVVGPGATPPANSEVTAVPDSAVSVTLLAADTNRRGAIFYNDSTEIAYIKLGAVASLASYSVQLNPGGTFILTSPVYTGIVDAIWAADAAGNMLVTEILL